MKVAGSMAEARAMARRGRVGLVPTMGFFHEGHLSLMERSAAECGQTMVSLYVNPLQFDDPADLARYPVDHGRDLELAEQAGADVMVIPGPDEMFLEPPLTRVSVAGIGDRLEAVRRPGHMDGVAAAVTKLFAGLQPDRAYFGRKDAQQLALVSRLVRDLGFPVEVVGCPLVREADGLALSSRNVLLGGRRREALSLSRGLMEAARLFEQGERRAPAAEEAVRAALPPGALDYAEACRPGSMERVEHLEGEAVLAAAARFGPVRLIDNVWFTDGGEGGEAAADRGVRLEGPSILYGDRPPGDGSGAPNG